MDRLIERCAGIDIHKTTLAVCVRTPGPRGERQQEVRTFGTTAADVLVLHDWLAAQGVTDVGMESTGVYWKPVYYALEADFTCHLVNAAHLRHVPGRKTDVQDCVWLAQVLEHGLIRGSFVPPPPIRELRDLTRYRKALIQDRTRAVNRLHKVLEDAGVKLGSVASDIVGVSGHAILTALAAGTTDPVVLADLARGRLRRKLPALRQALASRCGPHHRVLISEGLAHLEYLDESVARVSAEIEARLAPFAAPLQQLMTIPGVKRRVAESVLAELGPDMTVFPSAAHAASWTGLCPGHHESAGKRRSGRPRKGNRWLRGTLTEAALAAIRHEGAFAARYRRVLRRRGHKRAVVAVSHALLICIYHVLARGVPYYELGVDYYDRRHTERVTRHAVRLLERLGYHVTLEPAA